MKRLINLIAIVTGFAVITAFARIQAPELIVDAPDDWTITSEENIDAYGSAWDDSGRVAVFVNGDFAGSSNWYKNVALASGTNEITITAVNIYSNITEKIRHVICTANIEDTTPPEIVKVLPPDGFATIFRDIQMKIYATDNIGVESVTVNGESANPHSHKWVYNATLVPGTNEMEIIAKDAAGNQSTKIVDYILHNLPVDTNPPVLVVEKPDDGTETDAECIDVYGTASDDSGYVFVKVNGKCAGMSNWFKKVCLEPGTNEIQIVAIDISSNTTEEVRTVIRIVGEDTTPPEIVKVLPPDGFATIFRDVQMKIYATDNIGVESVTVNGESANPHSHKWVYNATLVPGTNEMEIIAKDAAGNQSTKIVDYILHNLPVDTNPPVLVVEKPDDGTDTEAECIDVYGTASDDSGYVFVKVNGKCAGMSNWFKKVCLEPGTNEIQIVAIDISSNTTEEVRTVIRIVGEDTTPPEIVKVLPPDGFATIFRDVQMKIYATDNIGVESVTVNGESANPHSHKWVYNATLVPGTNKMEIIAKDAAGNQSTKIVDYILHETNAIDLVVLTTNLHDAIVSNVYKSTLRAIGGVPPYKWSLIDGSLPEYIVLLANGDIIGIAKQVGDYEFTAQVIDANLSAATSAPLHLVVKASGEKPRIITKTLVDAVVKFPYEAPILIDSSDNWTFSTSDELPKGIELTTGGHLKGVPTKTGLYEIEINADNNKGETIDSVISMEVTDKEADTLYVSKVAKSKIAIARNKDRENSDKLVLKLQLTPETGFSLNNKKFSVNIGNYTVPLRVSQYKNYGKQVKLANTPLSNEELTIKGTVKFDKEGLLQLKVKVKNADLEEVLGIENSNQNNKEKHLPIEVVIGNDIAHSVLPMKLKSKEDKKATLKLQK